jgi:NADPH:quinone reductase-like Zn-dependent oxidoreductase
MSDDRKGSMKAVRIHEYGDASVLRYEDVPIPTIGPDEVLIKVRAAGVNPADCKLRSGVFRDKRPIQFPVILGTDVAGTIEEVGALVTRFHKGNRVISRVENSYAEFVAAKTDFVSRAPANVRLEQAGGIPVASGVAWLMLFEGAKLRAGQSVLVHAGAGGVGGYAVQLAKLAGATVYATCSRVNGDLVSSLGADAVIDYRTEDFVSRVRNVDVVLDTIGGETQLRSWGVLREGGVLVSIVSPPSDELAKKHGASGRFGRRDINGAILENVVGLIESDKIKVSVDREFALQDARLAHEYSETGHARGKIILLVG